MRGARAKARRGNQSTPPTATVGRTAETEAKFKFTPKPGRVATKTRALSAGIWPGETPRNSRGNSTPQSRYAGACARTSFTSA